jgi:pyroglutamyl-peptidase
MSPRSNRSGLIRILITGFGPYPGIELNASQWLAETLGRELPPNSASVTAAVLPVTWQEAALYAHAWISEVRPHAVLHFGVAPGADSIRVEMRAQNSTLSMPDASGWLPPAPWVAAGGPARLTTALGSPLLVNALRRRRVRARLSHNAGGYLCNYVFYRTLYWAARQESPPLVGFFHVPPVTCDADVSSSMSAEALVVGGRLIVRHAAALARRAARR